MIAVHPIPVALTYDFRSIVFARPRIQCYWKEDKVPGTFHLGGYLGETQKGTSTFTPRTDPHFPNEQAYYLTGLAVLEEARHHGLGGLMLLAGEDRIRQRGVMRIWCIARTPTVPFYEKYGWQTVGQPYEYTTEGLCIHMTKDLSRPNGCGAQNN